MSSGDEVSLVILCVEVAHILETNESHFDGTVLEEFLGFEIHFLLELCHVQSRIGFCFGQWNNMLKDLR